MRYAFWNNKGGTGKTSLAFQAICTYAQNSPRKRILAIDLCPQANLSELLLGGLEGKGSAHLLQLQGQNPRRTIGGYFQLRLPSPYSVPTFSPSDFIIAPRVHNQFVPGNIDLVCGDALVELQSNAMSTLANTNVPGTNTWLAIIDWLNNFLDAIQPQYDAVFIDANPSFSIYTQIALAAAERLVLPVMADDSSRRALQNAFSLVHGLNLPSPIYNSHAFNARLASAGRSAPQVHLIIKNRITQYMGPASAYAAVLDSITEQVQSLLTSHPTIFTFSGAEAGSVDVRDFQTTGVVAFALGCPFYALQARTQTVGGQSIQLKQDYLQNCRNAMNDVVAKL